MDYFADLITHFCLYMEQHFMFLCVCVLCEPSISSDNTATNSGYRRRAREGPLIEWSVELTFPPYYTRKSPPLCVRART